MIVNPYKKHSLNKDIESFINQRNLKPLEIDSINTVAFLTDLSEDIYKKPLQQFINELQISPDQVSVIIYSEHYKSKKDSVNPLYFGDGSFGIGGSVKNKSLKAFIEKPVDILINFYDSDNIAINYIAAASLAKMKIGLSKMDHRINDLIIGSSLDQLSLFNTELKKYLKTLQII